MGLHECLRLTAIVLHENTGGKEVHCVCGISIVICQFSVVFQDSLYRCFGFVPDVFPEELGVGLDLF